MAQKNSIKKNLPAVKVIFLTVSEHENDLMQAIHFGADGYLLKRCDISEVIGAIRKVAAGEAVLSTHFASKVIREFRGTDNTPMLSAREQQVMDLLTENLTNAEIVMKLVISTGTVNTYVYRLLQKLHLRNRAEAIAFTIQNRVRAN
jgi:DNA-binding NarL/FixJ family response regulator